MRYFLLLVLFSIFSLPHLKAEDNDLTIKFAIQAGVKPSFVFLHQETETFHIICSNAGEAPASWWVISAYDLPVNLPTKQNQKYVNQQEEWQTVSATKRMDFPYHNSFFFRYPDVTHEHLLITIGNQVLIYDLATGVQVNGGSFEVEGAHAVAARGDEIYVVVRIDNDDDYIADVNQVKVFDYDTKALKHTFEANQNVLQAEPIGQDMLAILSEGTSGNSIIQIFRKEAGTWSSVSELQAGDDANHMYYDRGKLMVTCNASHEVREFDLNDMSFVHTFSVPTGAMNGPRQSFYNPDTQKMVTTAYDGKIYVYDTRNDLLYKEFATNGKLEGIFYLDSYMAATSMLILAASPFVKDSYEENDKVYGIFYLPIVGSVDEEYFSEFSITPNPTSDYLHYDAKLANNDLGRANFTIYNYSGQIFHQFSQEVAADGRLNGSVNITNGNYPNGSYLLMIEINGKKIIRKFIINK